MHICFIFIRSKKEYCLKRAKTETVINVNYCFADLWQSFFFFVILKVATYKIYKLERDKPVDVVLAIAVYISSVNLLGLILMGIDKYKAKKRTFRIPEATLFTVAIFGGSLGTTLGMFLFRHKTRHWYFLYGMPLIMMIQAAIIYFLYHSPIEFLFL